MRCEVPCRSVVWRARVGRLAMVLLAMWAVGCGGAADAPPDGDRITVFAPVEPIAYVVRRVGGPAIDVQVLVPAGQDPHIFQLAPRQLAALGRAKLLFRVGLPLEDQLLERISSNLPNLAVVDVTKGIQKRSMSGEAACDHDDHDHAHDDHHDHACETGGDDLHVWLAPALLKIQAENVAKALEQLDPEHADEYAANLAALAGELDALDASIRKRLDPYRGRTFFVFHPSYGYFADAYGLRQEAVQVEGRSPAPKQLLALIEKARAENVHVIFAQPQFDQHRAQAVAEAIDGNVVLIDPLAGDVLTNLDDVAEKIAAAFSSH